MAFLDKVIEIARKDVQTIVLPEASDPRTIEATHKILEMGIAKVILVGNKAEILATAGNWKVEDALNEMKHGGYGFHPIWINIEKLFTPENIKWIREQLANPS